MTTTAIFGQSARDTGSVASNPTRLVNLWLDNAGEAGRTGFVMRSVLGLQTYADAGEILIRDLFEADGALYAIAADGLFKIGTGRLGTVASGENAVINRNGSVITAVVGGKYYTWDGAVLNEPSGPFTNFGSVSFLAGRSLLTERDGSKLCWSDIGAPNTLNGVNVATAESRDDKIIRGAVVGGVYMVLGERSTEVWYATGAGGAGAFALLSNSVVDIGLKAFGLIAKVDGAAFLIGDDDIAYLAAGTEFKAISTTAVNTALKEGQPTKCFYWEDRGHKFCGISFRDRPAWVYDIATGYWFERDYRGGAFDIAGYTKLGNDWIFGDANGKLFKLARTNADHDAPLRREATSFPIYNDGGWFSLAEAELFFDTGFDAATLMLQVSQDGVTFGRERTITIAGGRYDSRAVFRALGRARSATIRIAMTDPVDAPIWNTARVRLA